MLVYIYKYVPINVYACINTNKINKILKNLFGSENKIVKNWQNIQLNNFFCQLRVSNYLDVICRFVDVEKSISTIFFFKLKSL